MANNQINTYVSFEQANAPKRVTGIDYVRSIYKALNLPTDVVLWFARLFWPSFLVVDGRVFVADLFDRERYDGFRRAGHSEASAQFWTNLLEITGLFDDMPESQALEVAERLASSWNKKLEGECSEQAGRARVIRDNATEEVFVAIGEPD